MRTADLTTHQAKLLEDALDQHSDDYPGHVVESARSKLRKAQKKQAVQNMSTVNLTDAEHEAIAQASEIRKSDLRNQAEYLVESGTDPGMTQQEHDDVDWMSKMADNLWDARSALGLLYEDD